MLLLGREDGLTFVLFQNSVSTVKHLFHTSAEESFKLFSTDVNVFDGLAQFDIYLVLFLLKYTLTEILPTLHFKLDPLQSTKVARSNHHIRNWPTVNWPIVAPLAVNTQSAESRGVICVYFSHTVHVVTFFVFFSDQMISAAVNSCY